jgi:hypothetical protein
MDAVFPEPPVESLYFQCYPNAEDGVSNAENAGESMSSHDISRVTGSLPAFLVDPRLEAEAENSMRITRWERKCWQI